MERLSMSFPVRGPQGLRCAFCACSLSVASTAVADVLPFAITVVEYVPGVGAAAGYQDPQAALGWPERFTGEGLYPGVVSPFSSPWLSHEVVSIGLGGRLTLEIGGDIVDDPANPHGIDFIVFGNAFFWDLAWPLGIVGPLYAEGGPISVSEDGVNFFPVPGAVADGAMPTLGYLDVGPYSETPGKLLSDFRMPFDPALDPAAMVGLTFEEIREFYGTSGGGRGIDIAATGLERVRFVRIAGPAGSGSTEVDALTIVAPRLAADLDGDGAVGPADLTILLGVWGDSGKPGTVAGDLDGDGSIGGGDLAILLGAWS
jgi:hypothetical protein